MFYKPKFLIPHFFILSFTICIVWYILFDILLLPLQRMQLMKQIYHKFPSLLHLNKHLKTLHDKSHLPQLGQLYL